MTGSYYTRKAAAAAHGGSSSRINGSSKSPGGRVNKPIVVDLELECESGFEDEGPRRDEGGSSINRDDEEEEEEEEEVKRDERGY